MRIIPTQTEGIVNGVEFHFVGTFIESDCRAVCASKTEVADNVLVGGVCVHIDGDHVVANNGAGGDGHNLAFRQVDVVAAIVVGRERRTQVVSDAFNLAAGVGFDGNHVGI